MLIIAFIYCVIVCCYKEKLRVAIIILKASSYFLIEHMSSIFISLFVGIIWMILMVVHIVGLLTTMSNPDYKAMSYF